MKYLRPLLGAVLLTACEGQLEVYDIVRDSTDFERLPPVMRDFPVWDPATAAVYGFEARDGARRPYGFLRYESRLDAEAVAKLFAAHADSLPCKTSSASKNGTVLECGPSGAGSIVLEMDASPEISTSIAISFIDTDPSFEFVSF